MNTKKATDEQVIAAYRETGSCWKAAEKLGMGGQTVHERLVRLGAMRPMRRFLDDETIRLLRDYRTFRDAGLLSKLAAEMGRTVPFLCRKARDLGLTNPKAAKRYASTWKYMPEDVARGLMDRFKRSSFGLMQFCKRMGYADEGFSETMRRYFLDEWESVIEAKQPAQTMYRLGRSFEYRVRDYLRARGFFVLRSPASKSPIDLVAIRPGEVLLIQCKRGGGLAPGEWNELYDLASSCGATPVLAGTPTGRGLVCYRLTGRKDGARTSRQPYEPYEPEATPQSRGA